MGGDVGAADGDPLQLLRPGGDGVGNGPGIAGAAADVHPLSALDQGGCLLLRGVFSRNSCSKAWFILLPPCAGLRCPEGSGGLGGTGMCASHRQRAWEMFTAKGKGSPARRAPWPCHR